MLGGMDADVHRGGIDVQEQHIGRLAVAMQHVGVGGAQRVADRAVAHETAVDVQVLPVGARAAVGRVIMPARLTVPTACDSSRPCSANSAPSTSRMRCGGSAGSHCAARGRGGTGGTRCADAPARCVPSRPRNARIRWLPSAGTCGAPAPRRTAGARPRWCRAGPRRADLQAAAVDLPGVLAVARARDDGHLRDRGDGGQRLAAKSHRRHRFQFGQRADLAGGVARQRQRQFLGRGMPPPSSVTAMRRMPPPSSRTSMARAPASIAFSSTSLSTDAGCSMISPAAI